MEMIFLLYYKLNLVGKYNRLVEHKLVNNGGGLYALEGLPELQQAKER
jgi:hypothetical protein